jgi:hypothetical protein
LRDSAGLSPDFALLPAIAACAATPATYKAAVTLVKADQMIKY